MLTPKFQGESGGFEKYSNFWGPATNGRVLSIQADPDSLVVSYQVRFDNFDNGPGPTVLDLAFEDGHLPHRRRVHEGLHPLRLRPPAGPHSVTSTTPTATRTVAATRHGPNRSPKTTAPMTAPTTTLVSRGPRRGPAPAGLGPQHEPVRRQGQRPAGEPRGPGAAQLAPQPPSTCGQGPEGQHGALQQEQPPGVRRDRAGAPHPHPVERGVRRDGHPGQEGRHDRGRAARVGTPPTSTRAPSPTETVSTPSSRSGGELLAHEHGRADRHEPGRGAARDRVDLAELAEPEAAHQQHVVGHVQAGRGDQEGPAGRGPASGRPRRSRRRRPSGPPDQREADELVVDGVGEGVPHRVEHGGEEDGADDGRSHGRWRVGRRG